MSGQIGALSPGQIDSHGAFLSLRFFAYRRSLPLHINYWPSPPAVEACRLPSETIYNDGLKVTVKEDASLFPLRYLLIPQTVGRPALMAFPGSLFAENLSYLCPAWDCHYMAQLGHEFDGSQLQLVLLKCTLHL
ncbi:hypothetical protein N7468_010466 [Penicillium chermesinum]|uniref:Uncharacterized protein n=1 Tax=Penicillium chermesinum TaxID=63820 RepID=A0A9W9T9R3_9EURO|nr:uncharacterized protein N7468_010466 [Penicillium chermesinum]KAJ5214787.1 hypothetical protein N7468_010466 [Penicillium chermesinum]